MKVSGCCFVKDTFVGAFCMFESMASLLPFVDEYVVMDLGSTDGTLEYLRRIARANPRVKLKQGTWPRQDAGAFADLANELMAKHCENEVCWYHQADEVWHEKLLLRAERALADGADDLAFWRIQYRDNFQRVKWFPQIVHRIGRKGARFHFVGDGMNTDRYLEPPICSEYGGAYFTRWGEMGQEGVKPYVTDMILDVSLVGGFRDNIVERRALHAPFWHEEPHVEGIPASKWQRRAEANPDWTWPESPYDLPEIMKFHVGRVRYQLRRELLEALERDETRGLLGV